MHKYMYIYPASVCMSPAQDTEYSVITCTGKQHLVYIMFCLQDVHTVKDKGWGCIMLDPMSGKVEI